MHPRYHGAQTQYDEAPTPPAVAQKPVAPQSIRKMFVGIGSVLLALLVAMPFWNAVILYNDNFYYFFSGGLLPLTLIIASIVLVITYACSTLLFFHAAAPDVKTEQSIILISNVFITALGLIMILVALPMTRQSIDTWNNLMDRCETSSQTGSLFQYYMVLSTIRSQPDCLGRFSVEECVGYEVYPPYTDLLKEMENTFRCSGFCAAAFTKPETAAALLSTGVLSNRSHARRDSDADDDVKAFNRSAVSLLQISHQQSYSKTRRSNDTHSTQSAASPSRHGQLYEVVVPATEFRPKTLFSDSIYDMSCHGALGRRTKTITEDIGYQTFYQGILQVCIAVAVGFLKLVGHCIGFKRKPRTP